MPSYKAKMKATATANKTNTAAEDSTPIWPKDKHNLDDVCKAVAQVSEILQGMFHLMRKISPDKRGVFMFNKVVLEAPAQEM